MGNVKYSGNYRGIGQLLRSDKVKNLIIEEAEAMAQRCGEGYGVHYAKTRVRAVVYTKTQEASDDNLKNNTLLKRRKG